MQEEETRRLRFCWHTTCSCTAYGSTGWTSSLILVITHCSGGSMTLRIEYSLLDKRVALTLLKLSSFIDLIFSSLLSTRYSLAHSFEAQMDWSRRKHFGPVTNARRDLVRSCAILWLNGYSENMLLQSRSIARYTGIDRTLIDHQRYQT